MTQTTITAKGQIVIPARIRRHLALKKGMKFAVYEENNRVVFQPMNEAYFEGMAGLLRSKGKLTQSLLKERLRERSHEDRKR